MSEDSQTKHCCEDMRQAVQDRNIIFIEADDARGYYIHCEPRFEADGGDYYDDTTGTVRAKFCPFCGEKLPLLIEE